MLPRAHAHSPSLASAPITVPGAARALTSGWAPSPPHLAISPSLTISATAHNPAPARTPTAAASPAKFVDICQQQQRLAEAQARLRARPFASIETEEKAVGELAAAYKVGESFEEMVEIALRDDLTRPDVVVPKNWLG